MSNVITTIPDSAFRQCPQLTTIQLPRFCNTVASNAFAEDVKLTDIYIPTSVTSIQTNSISYPTRITGHGKSGSYGQTYANDRGMKFETVNAPITSMKFEQVQITVDRYQTFIVPLVINPAFDTDTVTFLSSDTGVATVSAIGEISTKKYGTATITAKAADGQKVATLVLNVSQPVEATGITLNKTSLEVRIGEASEQDLTLTATLIPANATNQTIIWTTSDREIVEVDNGKLILKKPGTATVTAVTSNGKSASCQVKVLSDVYIKDLQANVINNVAAVTVTTANVPAGTPVLVAAYDSRGVLLALSETKLQADGQAKTTISTKDVDKLKAFVWNANTLSPITDTESKDL